MQQMQNGPFQRGALARLAGSTTRTLAAWGDDLQPRMARTRKSKRTLTLAHVAR
jgi:hypothetical protein